MKEVSLVQASEMVDCGAAVDTGFDGLDALTGGIRGLCLFYGRSGMLDELVHRVIVRGCRAGSVAYMNNTNYHTAKTLLHTNRIAGCAKEEGMDPMVVFERVYFAAAYNQYRQPKAAEELALCIEGRDDTRLIVVHGATRFVQDAGDRRAAMKAVEMTVSRLWRTAAERSIAMLVTAETPRGMDALANTAVFFRDVQPGAVQAVLVKHPEKATPLYATVSAAGDPLMGRITPSFRQVYQAVLEGLRKNYLPLLRGRERRDAFETLVRKVWDEEHAAMANSQLPVALDAMNLTANVENRLEIERLKERVEKLERAAGGTD
ncbi:MAG: hypothetical protein JRN39_05000 [Nitrososphaerota archaeon]|nr:hypothetical protein [Nitrososphaerota archaeon]MDG6939742.1 hypothetical protein [Nitrososphaerota archaeon]